MTRWWSRWPCAVDVPWPARWCSRCPGSARPVCRPRPTPCRRRSSATWPTSRATTCRSRSPSPRGARAGPAPLGDQAPGHAAAERPRGPAPRPRRFAEEQGARTAQALVAPHARDHAAGTSTVVTSVGTWGPHLRAPRGCGPARRPGTRRSAGPDGSGGQSSPSGSTVRRSPAAHRGEQRRQARSWAGDADEHPGWVRQERVHRGSPFRQRVRGQRWERWQRRWPRQRRRERRLGAVHAVVLHAPAPWRTPVPWPCRRPRRGTAAAPASRAGPASPARTPRRARTARPARAVRSLSGKDDKGGRGGRSRRAQGQPGRQGRLVRQGRPGRQGDPGDAVAPADPCRDGRPGGRRGRHGRTEAPARVRGS